MILPKYDDKDGCILLPDVIIQSYIPFNRPGPKNAGEKDAT